MTHVEEKKRFGSSTIDQPVNLQSSKLKVGQSLCLRVGVMVRCLVEKRWVNKNTLQVEFGSVDMHTYAADVIT